MNRLRFKLSMLIIPLVVLVVVASGTLSSMEAQKSMIQAANRHLAYKAEQLRDYAYSEWGVIEKLNMTSQAEYREASERSIQSYAVSLLRSETEQILIFDAEGTLIRRLGLQLPAGNLGEAGDQLRYASGAKAQSGQSALKPGWFSGNLLGEQRIAVVFTFEAFEWTIAVTEIKERFFSGINDIIRIQALILIIAILVVSSAISVYVGHVVRPVEHLSNVIEQIAVTQNMNHRASVENNDEIGYIANRFNTMIGALQASQEQVTRTSLAEAKARNKAIESELETLYLLGRISDFRDEQTGSHQDRISSLSRLLARYSGLDVGRQEMIMRGSRLHDIGKIAIPDSILLKPGNLTPYEFEIIKTHTDLGNDLLKNSHSEALLEGATIAFTHHEKWDGSGYPRGLAGEEIPVSGRIVAIVDVFDALTSDRPYKKKWTNDDALAYIVEQRGKHFDPKLVDVFNNNFMRFAELLDNPAE